MEQTLNHRPARHSATPITLLKSLPVDPPKQTKVVTLLSAPGGGREVAPGGFGQAAAEGREHRLDDPIGAAGQDIPHVVVGVVRGRGRPV